MSVPSSTEIVIPKVTLWQCKTVEDVVNVIRANYDPDELVDHFVETGRIYLPEHRESSQEKP